MNIKYFPLYKGDIEVQHNY